MSELDWISTAIGAGLTGGGGFLAFRLLATVSDFTSKRYREAATYANDRVDALEADVTELRDELRRLEHELGTQRKLKHDWRGLAGSLWQERFTIRRFAELHDCAEISELMDRLDAFRRDNPLMVDLRTLTDEDAAADTTTDRKDPTP